MKVQKYNIQDAKKYFGMYNVRYFISESVETFNEMKKDFEWKAAKSVGGYTIYESRKESHYVVVPDYEPIIVNSKQWRELSLEWFYSVKNLDVPLVFDETGIQEESILDGIKNGNLKSISKKINKDCNIQEQILDDEIRFETSCIGLPHLVKFSYFPNWKVSGTEQIYPATPGFMVVYPTESNVRIYYGTHFSEVIGNVMSFVGLVILALRIWFERGVKSVLG